MRVIGIVSGKGGVGKTTSAINLGAVLSSRFNKNVTVVDCNITTPHLGLSLGLVHDSVNTLNESLKDKRNTQDIEHNYSSSFSIVPSSLTLQDLKSLDLDRLNDVVRELKNKDIVLLDIAPGLGREAISAIKACDQLVFISTPYLVSLSDILRTKQVAKELNKEIIGVVVNMKHEKHSELTESQIENFTQLPVLGTINYDKDILASLISKQPLVFYNERSKTAKEYTKIAGHLLGMSYRTRENMLAKLINFISGKF
ncbi:MAG: P-loop NTPase [Candidatus Aenigmarchaeota archaeon]|nr:P-loop NTPase [Candidatus Aenigmarchaeota archaeon]